MTRKDYVLIAATLASHRRVDYPNRTDYLVLCERFAEALERSSGFNANGNRRFDRDRFLAACGVDQ
jgi:hypothetical protein